MEQTPVVSKKNKILSWVFSGLAILFLIFDGIGKLVKPQQVIDATVQLGYPVSTITGIGILLLICIVLYLIPGTAIIGAILLTGFLGGAIATHVRLLNPLFSHMLFPVYLGIFLWLGLYLRNPLVKKIVSG